MPVSKGEGPFFLVGIGLGPANLAMAVAVAEREGAPRLNQHDTLFLEHKSGFAWHPNMQVDEARIQTPFMKDLITQCNPRSHFTFLNYLKESGRLDSFINLREFYPTRHEFDNYFRWVALQLSHMIRYDVEVEAIQPVHGRDGIDLLQIRGKRLTGGSCLRVTAYNISIGVGMTPKLLDGVDKESRLIIHSSRFLKGMQEAFSVSCPPQTLLVVGAGQSGAEILYYLLKHFPHTELHAVSRGFLYRSIDANCFVNDLYTDDATIAFYAMSSTAQKTMRHDLRDTNYGVVDEALIREIYSLIYNERVVGKSRLKLHSYTTVLKLQDIGNAVHVTMIDNTCGKEFAMVVDGVILATGYDQSGMRRLMATLEPYIRLSDTGDYNVDINHRLMTAPECRAGIYLQGYAEHTHGFTEGTISNLGPRAKRIITALLHSPVTF